jgi:hypothetical protein
MRLVAFRIGKLRLTKPVVTDMYAEFRTTSEALFQLSSESLNQRVLDLDSRFNSTYGNASDVSLLTTGIYGGL